MATQSVSKRSKLVTQVRDSLPPSDRAVTPLEVEFLLTYRAANKADKRRLMKILHAAGKGLLPTPEQSRAMTPEQNRAFADALPEVDGREIA